MEIDRKAARDAFSRYVLAYDPENPKIALKIAHTYRVAELCDTIAQSLALPPAEIDLAWLCGLLHDVGRFEQVRRYGTFNDGRSVEHARLSAQILFADGHIRDYIADTQEDALLETAVSQHSAYRLPEQLDARTRRFCDILRDADKIDILRANCDTPLTAVYNVSEEELRTSPVSPAVMGSFARRHATLRSLKKTPADNIAALASLVFELVYPVSVQLVMQQGYLARLLHFDSRNPETQAQFARLRSIMDDYLRARIGQADD